MSRLPTASASLRLPATAHAWREILSWLFI